MSHGIIMNPTSDEDEEAQRQALEHHKQRVREAQALFMEALRRYKVQRGQMNAAQIMSYRTDEQLTQMALKTLIMNGYSRAEVVDAMMEQVPADKTQV